MAANTATTDGMLNPYQAAAELADRRLELQGVHATITQASEQMLAASQRPDQFIGNTTETAQSLTTKRLGELEAQQLTQRVAQATNITELMLTLGQDINQLAQKRRAIDAKITEDSSVSLFEDPLTALANAFTLPWDQQARDALDKQITNTADTLAKAHSHVQQSSQTASVIATKLTDASVASVAGAAKNLADQHFAAAQLTAAKTKGELLDQSMKMTDHQLNLWLKNEQSIHTQKTEARAAADHQRRLKILDMQLGELEDKKKAEAMELQLVNAALVDDGKKPIADMNRFNQWKAGNADYINSLKQRGLMLLTAEPGTVVPIANTIDGRLDYMRKTGWMPNTKQQEKVLGWQTAATTKAAEQTTNKSMIAVNKETEFRKIFDAEQGNITEGSAFEAPAYTAMLNSPEIRNHPIFQKYVVPALDPTSIRSASNPDVILSAATRALADGAVDATTAAKFVSSYFTRAVKINNDVHEFRKIAGRSQTSYTAPVSLGGGFFADATYGLITSRERVDLTDPLKVQYAIQKLYVSNVVQRSDYARVGAAAMSGARAAGPAIADAYSAAPGVALDGLGAAASAAGNLIPPAVPFPNLPAQFQGAQTYEQRTGQPFYSTLKPIDSIPRTAHKAMEDAYGLKEIKQ